MVFFQGKLPPDGKINPEAILGALAKYRNVSMFGAPTMVTRLVNHPRAGAADTRGLKTILAGGAFLALFPLATLLGAGRGFSFTLSLTFPTPPATPY